MSARRLGALVACLALAFGVSRFAATPAPARPGAIAAGARASATPVAAPRPRPPEPAAAEVTPPHALAPPGAERSWVVPLELGWDGATADTLIRRAVAFRPAIAHPSDARFRARVVDAQGAAFVCDVPVRGLIPLELADGREFFAVGDQLLLARAPVLLRLPDVPLPARVELLRPDAQRVAVLELTEGGVSVLSD